MIINNRLCALIFRISLLAVGFTGVLIFFFQVKSPSILKYFSVVTAIFNLIFYAYLTLKTAVELRFSGVQGSTMLDVKARGFLLGGVLSSLIVDIAVNMHTYGIAGAITNFSDNYTPAGILIKLVLPAMLLLDWLLFTRKFKFTCGQAFVWLLYPLAFFAVLLGRSVLRPGSDFVYYFLDYRSMGLKGVIISVVIISTLFVIANLMLILADTVLGEPSVIFSWSTEKDD